MLGSSREGLCPGTKAGAGYCAVLQTPVLLMKVLLLRAYGTFLLTTANTEQELIMGVVGC